MANITNVDGVSRANAYMIPVEQLHDGDNPRRWTDTDVAELALELLDRGKQLVPVIVRWSDSDPNQLEIVDGHRRAAAIRYINEQGLATEPWKVRCELFSGENSFEAAVAATHKRKGFSAVDLANIITTLEKRGRTRKEIAKLLDISEPLISQSLKLLTLPAGLQKDIHKGKLSASAGYEMADLSPEDRAKMAEESKATSANPDGSSAAEPVVTRTKVRKAKRAAAEAGESTRGSKSRSRKEVYQQFADWAGCGDGTIEDSILKLCATITKWMDGEVGERAVLNRMRELMDKS